MQGFLTPVFSLEHWPTDLTLFATHQNPPKEIDVSELIISKGLSIGVNTSDCSALNAAISLSL